MFCNANARRQEMFFLSINAWPFGGQGVYCVAHLGEKRCNRRYGRQLSLTWKGNNLRRGLQPAQFAFESTMEASQGIWRNFEAGHALHTVAESDMRYGKFTSMSTDPKRLNQAAYCCSNPL